MPDRAFILAAGKGTRMKPLTDTKPKPMMDIDGQTVIDHILDSLLAFGVKQVMVNLHYLGNQLENHLKNRTDIEILFSKEHVLLDTGGGLRKGARTMGDDPFFVINGDAFWTEGPDKPAFERLANAWDADKMDMLLLLQDVKTMTLTQAVGDYTMDDTGRLTRSRDQTGTHMFTSLRIMKPQILRGTPEGPFSFLSVMDNCESQMRLYGLEHDGDWHHISTPEDLKAVNESLSHKAKAAP